MKFSRALEPASAKVAPSIVYRHSIRRAESLFLLRTTRNLSICLSIHCESCSTACCWSSLPMLAKQLLAISKHLARRTRLLYLDRTSATMLEQTAHALAMASF